jgi:glutamate/tyrosine decarboxylase-like PLP-dependent enzyme
MSDPSLYPCFLGPYGENDQLLESLVVEFLRDHVYWRRNLYPEDLPAIPTHARQRADFQDFEARLRRELHRLSAALKRSVPFHSPRYLGHMVSDLLLPGLTAQILTLPYNPNNVSAEAAPVTIDMEIEAGLQLAAMVGYESDPRQADCALGHLTSGGTVANYQALRLALALKAFPVALRAVQPPGLNVPDNDVAAFNLHPRAALALYVTWQNWLGARSADERTVWLNRLTSERIEHLGLVDFFAKHPGLRPPVVLVPATAHYSWSKAVKLLGLGRAQMLQIPQRAMRMDADALEHCLTELAAAGQPVLACIGVIGSTEFGTVDPLDAIIQARESWSIRGLGFAVHADAAWGGYLATLLRDSDGRLRSRDAVAREFAAFPSRPVYAALAALAETDSVTVDPHKLGHLAYGAGAFLCRDHRAMELLAESADYVFHAADCESAGAASDPATRYRDKHRHLGRVVVEGSKPGAMAAAVCVTHRVLPLHSAGFGRLIATTLRSTEALVDALAPLAERLRDRVRLILPFPADSNLVCLAFNPVGNRSLAAANRFVERLYQPLRADADAPRQDRAFYGCLTSLRVEALGVAGFASLLADLGISPTESADEDRLLVLRHTLMNPYLIDDENGLSYIDAYLGHLAHLIERSLPETCNGLP